MINSEIAQVEILHYGFSEHGFCSPTPETEVHGTVSHPVSDSVRPGPNRATLESDPSADTGDGATGQGWMLRPCPLRLPQLRRRGKR